MTLIVGMKVPDGLVLAADSLVTTQILKPIRISGKIDCEKCGHGQQAILEVPIQIPSSISPNAQKIFSVCDEFSIGTFGKGIVNGKSMYSHFKILDQMLERKVGLKLKAMVEKVCDYFEEQLSQEAKKKNIKLKRGFLSLWLCYRRLSKRRSGFWRDCFY